MRCSIIIPVLNEAAIAARQLQGLASLRDAGAELIVVDGGSDDATVSCCEPHVDRVLRCEKAQSGRARQMNVGADHAGRDVLLFLHLDSSLPADVITQLQDFIQAQDSRWGFFRVRLDAAGFAFRLIETMMNWRSALTSVATGDQALLVRAEDFSRLGGFADMPLMEDVNISKRLRKIARRTVLRGPLTTSARRWKQQGILRTVWLMWELRARYFFGARPEDLVKRYYLRR